MENKKTKIVIIIAVIVVLILLAIFLAVKLFNIKNNKKIPTINTNNEIKNETNNNVAGEVIQNNSIVNEIIQNNNINDNTVNETVGNITDENVVVENNSQQVSKEEIDNETIQKEEDNKEKAINIVKENWGEDDKVYFSFDSIDNNGKYIVSVRDRISTEALYWYAVDIEKGTFSIE